MTKNHPPLILHWTVRIQECMPKKTRVDDNENPVVTTPQTSQVLAKKNPVVPQEKADTAIPDKAAEVRPTPGTYSNGRYLARNQ